MVTAAASQPSQSWRFSIVIATVVALLTLNTAAFDVSKVGGQGPFLDPGTPESVTFEPESAAVRPGGTVNVAVQGISYFRPPLLEVSVPADLELVGEPACSASGFVYPLGDSPVRARPESLYCDGHWMYQAHEHATLITTSSAPTSQGLIYYILNLEFTLRVSANAVPGTAYSITAPIAGLHGETEQIAIEVLDASGSRVTPLKTPDPLPTAPPTDPAMTELPENEAYLDVTPRLLRVAPGGSALYFVQPIFWGDWSGAQVDYIVEVALPSDVHLAEDPICGPRQSTVPTNSTCEIDAEEQGDGSTLITAFPASMEVGLNGLYVTVEFAENIAVDTQLQIDASIDLFGDLSYMETESVSLSALVVEPSAFGSLDESGTVSARLEMTSGYSRQGDTCTSDWYSTEQVVLNEWGGQREFARIDFPVGHIGVVSDGTGTEGCIFEFAFENVPEFSVYVVGHAAPGWDDVCRACVFGLVTPAEQAVQVLVPDSTEE